MAHHRWPVEAGERAEVRLLSPMYRCERDAVPDVVLPSFDAELV
jgi:hypothetical protein